MSEIELSTKQADLAFGILSLCEQSFPEDHEIKETLPVLKLIFETVRDQVVILEGTHAE